MSDTLGQRAFSVFCDTVARSVVEKNSSLRAENDSLTPIRDVLCELQILCAKMKAIKVDVRSLKINEDDEYYVHNLEDPAEVPHSRLKGLYCVVNGVLSLQHHMHSCPKITIQDDEIHLKLEISGVILVGKVINHEGTLEDVQHLLDGNYRYFFSMMGLVDAATGEPALDTSQFLHGNVLENSTFLLESIKVAKRIVQPTLDAEKTEIIGAQPTGRDSFEFLSLMEAYNTTVANLRHKSLIQAMKDNEILRKENTKLSLARGIFQEVRGRNSQTGETLFKLYLNEGSQNRMMCSRRSDGHKPVWCMQPKDGNADQILLSSLAELQITLGNVPICSRSTLSSMGRPIPTRYGFILKYQLCLWEAEAYFMFNNSCVGLTDDPDFLRRVEYTLIPEHQTNITINGQNGPVSRLDGMTVGLAFVQIALSRLEDRLELLGIEVSATEVERAGEQEGGGGADGDDAGAEGV